MKRISTNSFTTITTQGGLFPPEFLQRIGAQERAIEGMTAKDYHLPEHRRINEQANRAWSALLADWKAFKEKVEGLDPADPATGVTRDQWLLPLFEQLGYGRLKRAGTIEIDGKDYPVSHGWEQSPIHLVGWNVDLEKRASGVAGAARFAPHGMMQEFLNRSDDHLWGFVSNGRQLRILRDNISMTRQAYVEFDLVAMMDGECFSDFVLLWLLCHYSRVEVPLDEAGKPRTPEACWLERWSREAESQGARLLDHLREGVEQAIQTFGSGFLAHPANQELRDQLRSGQLDKQDYYRQLLRLVYRLIFLFVAEDRDLLHETATDAHKKKLYFDHYSTQRIRRIAEAKRGSHHRDLWESFKLLFHWLCNDEGCARLGLTPFGGFLFSTEAMPDLIAAKIANIDLLSAIRSLAVTDADSTRRPVDYRNLGAEELGSIYESLLEMHPNLHLEAATFQLDVAAGNERKSTGSYYTPKQLVNCLLNSALDPVVEQRLKEARKRANGDWRAANGGAASTGGQENANGISEIRNEREWVEYVYTVVSGSRSLAEGTPLGQWYLSAHRHLSQGGTLWDDLPDAAGGRLDSVQHSGGLGTTLHSGIHSVSAECERQSDGTGNPADHQRRSELGGTEHADLSAGTNQHTGQAAFVSRTGTQEANGGAEANGEWGIENGEIVANSENASPQSPFPTPQSPPSPHSPLASLNSLLSQTPFPIRYSLFAEKALLSLRICDPACGSGHFLIGAAHRIAKHLASVRSGDAEPSPEATHHALRDVITHCIYGVDINPMSVELCKVSLWMEAMEPGKPLGFLDHHIKCGNSLLGTTPALLSRGIPDDAFNPIEGDIKTLCSEYRKQNKSEATGQADMFADMMQTEARSQVMFTHAELASRLKVINEHATDSLEDVHWQENYFRSVEQSESYRLQKFLADTWCAAFLFLKDGSFDYPITNGLFNRIQENSNDCADWMQKEIKRIADQSRFFHWHVEFPDVFHVQALFDDDDAKGWEGGFDCLLGNPPWERIKLQEKEWFAARDSEIANAPNAAARKRLIHALIENNPQLHAAFLQDKRQAEAESTFTRNSGRFPLCGRGDVNTYTLFAETFKDCIAKTGRSGVIVPSGICTDDTTKFFFQNLVESKALVSLFDFENRKAIFPSVHRSFKFCLLTMGGSGAMPPEGATFSFFALDVEDLKDTNRVFTLSAEDIELINPNTRTCPIFRTRRDAELTKAIYRRVPVLIREARDGQPEQNPWGISFLRMFDMANDSGLFHSRENLDESNGYFSGNIFNSSNGEQVLPLYEAKMCGAFDHRTARVVISETAIIRQGQPEYSSTDDLMNPSYSVDPRFWVERKNVEGRIPEHWKNEWCLVWRRVSSPTNERTVLPSLLPISAVGDSLFMLFPKEQNSRNKAMLYGMLGAFVFDFISRQKMGGVNVSYFILEQLPILSPMQISVERSRSLVNITIKCILELTYTAWNLGMYGNDCGYAGPPFIWNEDRRFEIRCELDAAFFHLYGIDNEDDVDYIMETFPIVKRKDEKQYGSYRTKNRILEIYREMARCTASSADSKFQVSNFKSHLTPPPGPPCDEQGNFIPVEQWHTLDPVRISHIHPPQEVAKEVQVVAVPAQRYPFDAETYAYHIVPQLIRESGGKLPIKQAAMAYALLADTNLRRQLNIGPYLGWEHGFDQEVEVRAFRLAVDKLVRQEFLRWKGDVLDGYFELDEWAFEEAEACIIEDAKIALAMAKQLPEPLQQTSATIKKLLESLAA